MMFLLHFRWLWYCICQPSVDHVIFLGGDLQDSWSSTLQVILITFAAMYFSTAMIFPFLGRSLHVLGAFSRSSGSPLKTPVMSDVSGGPGSPVKEASRSSLRFLRQRLFVDVPSMSHSTVGQETHAKNAEKGDVSKDDESTSFLNSRVGNFISTIESTFRGLILDNIHSIVTLILIVSLILGTSGTTMFLGLRMAEEARSAVVTARNAFPTAWSKTIYNAPSFLEQDLMDAIVGDFVKGEELGMDNQTSKRAFHRLASDMSLPSWLEAHQQNAIDLAQKALPSVASWIENRFDDFLRTHNLTDTIMDIRHLYETARGPRECSERERMKLMIALSQADVSLRHANNAEIEVRSTLERLHTAMSTKLDALEKLFFCGDNNNAQRSSTRQNTSCDNDYSGTEEKLTDPYKGFYNKSADTAVNDSFQELMNGNDKEIQSLQSAIVELDSELAAATSAHHVAVSRLEQAESTHGAALTRLQLCQRPQSQAANDDAGTSDEAGLGILMELSANLESAYSKIFWHFHFRQGFDDLREAFYHAIKRLTAESSAATDLSRLQRVAQTAAVPLIALGRAVAIPLGSSAAAAIMGGFGLLRLGLSVFHLGVQSTLFFTLLYYLLSAKTDPVARAVGVLPLPPNARRHAAEVINTALGGVLISLLKLSAAHGLYTWLTFRALNVPMAYTASVASSAFALLPFVPTYAVALPGSLAVAAQGRLTTAIILLALHFAGYYIGDTILLEDSGGHPFMMSLSILGGLWAFSNPLLGCLLGPILLSLLTAVASLHTELMAGSGGGLGAEQGEENDGATHFPSNCMRPMKGHGGMREKYRDEPPKELRASSLRSPEATAAPNKNRTSLSCPQEKCGESHSIDESVSFEFDQQKSLSEVSSKEVL